MPATPKSLVGVVVSAGKMQRAVKVLVSGQKYNSFLRKHFNTHKPYLVSDPNSSLLTGDVIRIENEGRLISKHIKHVVSEIIAPWGTSVAERPPVLSREERHARWREGYRAKVERRTGRRLPEGFDLRLSGVRGVAAREMAKGGKEEGVVGG